MTRCTRTAIILPVVLIIVGMLALTLAGYVYFVRAEAIGTSAFADAQQARLAAESGLEELVAVLRVEKHNFAGWFDVPTRFRHALVWGEGFNRESDPVRKQGVRTEILQSPSPAAAWRYSLVASRLDGPPGTMRFGVTPESSKLNINVASDDQLTQLMTPLLVELGVENPQQIIDAILDWRDTDTTPRDAGAENEYYNTLQPPYSPKNGPLDTVEEMLLVKGVSAATLYGEDVNQNGILDANEDDGEASFPYYDNGDGVLNRGLAPYLTVYSREVDTALDNKQRINVNGEAAIIAAQMAEYFQEGELSAATMQFLGQLSGQGSEGRELRSPADLYGGGGSESEGEGQESAAPPFPNSPITLEEMPYIMDRFSTRSAEQAQAPLFGLININTAPALVLSVIPGMTAEAVAAIVDGRQRLDPAALTTTAWPLVSGSVSPATFRAIAPYITTKSLQFHVEVLGYADHLRTVRRFEWVIEMVGPLAQVKYYRDLSSLGQGWPIDEETVVVTN